MKKISDCVKNKRFIIVALIVVFLVVLGIVLLTKNGTQYLVCKMWLTEDNVKRFIYARSHIKSYAIGYFGGIASLVAAGAVAVLFVVKSILAKKETKVSDETHEVVD